MSGDLTNGLNDPALYPNWMWILGTVLVVAVLGWIVYSIWRWWTSRIGEVMELQTITDARRKKYLTYVDQIADRYAWAPSERAETSRSQPSPKCASSSPCGRAWPTCCRPAKSPVSRAMTSRRGSPLTRPSPTS